MAYEVSPGAARFLVEKIPAWWGRIRYTPCGCERFCMGTSQEDVNTWIQLNERSHTCGIDHVTRIGL